jgi:hypothetical protein
MGILIVIFFIILILELSIFIGFFSVIIGPIEQIIYVFPLI